MSTDTPGGDAPPLTPEDFDAQDDALDRMREAGAAVPDWEFCDGFLTALVCSRRDIADDEAWPQLLGEGFAPMAHMEFVWRWRRRRAEVARALDADVQALDDPRTLEPAVVDVRGAWLAQDEAERVQVDAAQLPSFGEHWALGFLAAVDAWPQDWAAPRDPDAAAMLEESLAALDALAAPDAGPFEIHPSEENGPPSVSRQRLDDYAEAIWSVYDLRQLWRSLGPSTAPLRKAAEPGRNDPCPCGSGKKFKKCHGA